MYCGNRISAIIPARNESLNIEHVVCGLSQLSNATGQPLIDEIIVCDNGSTDDTATIASLCGAKVVSESNPGYGAACLRAAQAAGPSDIYLFVDGDDSIQYEDVLTVLAPIARGADLVIGARAPHLREPGAMTFPQRFGNRIAVLLIKLLWNEEITDLGPFRAVRVPVYQSLCMQDDAFGWTVEMQVKAIQLRLDVVEVAVRSKCRRGTSKISGSFSGVVNAARGILGTILTLWVQEKNAPYLKKSIISG